MYLKITSFFSEIKVRHFNKIPPKTVQYLSVDDICGILSISRSTFERLRKTDENGVCLVSFCGREPKFPPPDLTVGRILRWEIPTVKRWIETTSNIQRNYTTLRTVVPETQVLGIESSDPNYT